MLDKENVGDISNVQTPPLPDLVPMRKKSSGKKVRFSLDTQVPPERESPPIRLNRDILGENEEIPNPNRVSIASHRRSSIASDSPLHFPSQAELVAGPSSFDSSGPIGSPSDSRQSTGSAVTVDILSSALGGGIPQAERPRSIWDTPSSSAKKPSTARYAVNLGASPVGRPSRSSLNQRHSVGTPGNAEQKMFNFSVVLEQEIDREDRESEASSSPPIVVPSPLVEEDPMLLSGASSRIQARRVPASGDDSESVTTSRKRRKRRLSHFDDIESELLNVSSPERYKPQSTPISVPKKTTTVSDVLGVEIDSIFNEDIDDCKSTAPESRLSAGLVDPELRNIAEQQEISIQLTRESAIDWIQDLLSERRSVLVAKRGEVEKIMAQPADTVAQLETSSLAGKLLGETVRLRILENQVENVSQTEPAIVQYKDTLLRQREEVDQVLDAAKSLGETIEELTGEFRAKIGQKFVPNSSTGKFERIKSDSERRLDELDVFIKGKEDAIRQAIEEISAIEDSLSEKQREYTEGFSKMRQFYLDNGWNVVCQVHQGCVVIVYAVCHLLVFEKASNDTSFWKLDRIVAAKIDPSMPPYYAPNLLSSQVRFNNRLVLDQLVASNGLNVAFEYDPAILHELMAAAVTALCEWVTLRETIASCLPTAESRAKINSNLQIEISLVIMNNSLGDGVEVPMLVKLLWFDPIFSAEGMRFDNFSFIASEAMVVYFPSVKSDIDERLSIIHPSDVYSPTLLRDIVKAVSSVLINARLGVPSYA